MTIAGSDWDHRLARLANLDPVLLRRLVDVACAGFAVALFLRLADPEILLQGLWLVVAIGAFVYGLTAALWRIAVACAVMVGYIALSDMVGVPATQEELDFTEWPLMVAIALIVAVLADRVSTSARHYASLYRRASERLVTAHEEERASLARELHDGVGQTLTAVILTLDAVDSELASGTEGPGTGRTAVLRARELASSALAETRQVAAKLRPTRVHELGLGAAIANLARTAGVPVDLRFDPTTLPPGLLEPELEIDVYRIVQEAVSNAARHSHARHVWITAHIVDDTLRLLIGDDGAGFDQAVARGHGLGLDGMQERATIHGLELEVRSRRGAGTRIALIVPTAREVALPDLQLGPAPRAVH